MPPSQRILIVVAAGLLPTASAVLAGEKQTSDDRPVTVAGLESPDVIQSAEPVAELSQPEEVYLDYPEYGQRKIGWRSKLSHLINWHYLNRRFWRHAGPYNSTYKPLPPYHLENKGYYSSCWRRLSADGRPCPPVVGSYVIETEQVPAPIQSDASPIPPAPSGDDFAAPPMPKTLPAAPALPLPKDEFQLPKELKPPAK